MNNCSNFKITIASLTICLIVLVSQLTVARAVEIGNKTNNANYHEIARIAIGAGGSFPVDIAVNPTNNTIYVFNQISSNISIIDGASNKITGTFTINESVSHIAVNTKDNTIYVAGQRNFFIFDAKTRQKKATVSYPAQFFLEYIVVNENTSRIYLGVSEGSVLVVDGNAGTLIQTLKFDSKVSGLAINADANQIFVNTGEDNRLVVIDGSNNSITSTIKL